MTNERTHKTGPNPFIDLSRDRLAQVCGELAAELGEAKPRSPEERLELANACRFALIAAQRRLDLGMHQPGAPADTLRRDPRATYPAVYCASLATRQQALRWELLEEAADLALGSGAATWLRDLGRRGAESEEQFRNSLEALEIARRAKR
jgi:hypothetical protein